MRRGPNTWDIRMQNAGRNALDEFGNATNMPGSHDIFIINR